MNEFNLISSDASRRNLINCQHQKTSEWRCMQGCEVGVGGVACFQLESESGVGVVF